MRVLFQFFGKGLWLTINMLFDFSVIGLNLDYVVLNVLGHSVYGLFNFGLYWIASVQVIRELSQGDVYNHYPLQSFCSCSIMNSIQWGSSRCKPMML